MIRCSYCLVRNEVRVSELPGGIGNARKVDINPGAVQFSWGGNLPVIYANFDPYRLEGFWCKVHKEGYKIL